MSDSIPQETFDMAADVLKIAKITMMMQKDTVFYTTILFSLKQLITDKISTAATDGKSLLINPEFFCDLSVNERITLLAHEILHVALDHMHRRGDRDPKIWNVAADYVINNALVKAGYSMPKDGLVDRQYDNMTTEQVYDIIYKKSDPKKQKLIVLCAMDVQYPENAGKGKEVPQGDVTEIIMRATTQAKAMGQDPGSVPAEIDISLQRTLNPPLPWNVILQNYLTEFSKDDYTFKRPNRRFLPDHYLPTAHSEAVANIAVCVDTSSSVSDNEFNDFITKIAEIQKVMNPKKITVMAFNTKFVSEQEVTENEDPFRKLKFKGRGGTNIQPVHDWIKETKPTVAIIFTDGRFSEKVPLDKSVPLIWLIYGNATWTTKYGRTINYEIPI